MDLDINYCYRDCAIGRAASEEFLSLNDSVFDAAFDFQSFTENCFKTCIYKAAQADNKCKEF